MLWQNNLKGCEEWFEATGADGVDFHGLFDNPLEIKTILQSNTKEEMLSKKIAYPRSDYTFWKNVNGYKVYLVGTNTYFGEKKAEKAGL